MDAQKKCIIETFERRAIEIERLIDSDNVNYISKSAKISTNYRNVGNTLYKKKQHDSNDHEEILRNYCHSISFAPTQSRELMLAYGNRSAFLLHVKKFNESIKDIDRALDMSGSNVFKIKLLCRKSECLLELESLPESKSALNEAKILLKSIENKEDKKTLQALVSKVETSCSNKKYKNLNEAKECKTLNVSETSDIFNTVAIKYTEKYGRGLVALHNFKPGKIIFVEKLHATIPDLKSRYKYCHHCLLYSWAGIPCENCHMALFCSEECKNEAMTAYHDIECAVVPELTKNGLTAETFYFSIRLLIMGLKEIPSFEKLKSILQLIDQKSDKCSLGMKNDEIDSQIFSSIYDLNSTSKRTPTNELAYSAIFCLILIAKKTNIFGDILNQGFTNFMKNEDIIFIGSLLIKLIEIVEVNSLNFTDMVRPKCLHKVQCRGNQCCKRGSCISPLASLLNHNCFPNTSMCFTEDKKIIIFALQPIKKDDMLFSCYCSPFYVHAKDRRHDDLKWSKVVCDCQACVENWSPVLANEQLALKQMVLQMPKSQYMKIFNGIGEIILNDQREDFEYNEEHIKKLAKSIIIAFQNYDSFSPLTCSLVDLMRRVFVAVYGLKEQISFNQLCK